MTRRWPALLVLGALLIGVGGWQLASRGGPRSEPVASKDWGDPDQVTVNRAAASRATGDRPAAARPADIGPVPLGSTLTLARLGLRAPVVPIGVSAGVMAVPRDPRTLGWWAQGARPGAGAGTAVIVGHVNYAGTTGVLAALPQTRPGDELVLAEHQLRLRYRVTALRTYAKTSGIPAATFRTTGPPRLVLITCGGPFDPGTGNYLDNIVAFAEPEPN